MTEIITESEWARLWAQARARGAYPPFICEMRIVPDAEADRPTPGWLARLIEPEPEPEAGL